METQNPYCIVMTTCDTREEARNIARSLVEKRLAACVQTLPVSSCFMWEGKVSEEDELLLLIKARGDGFGKIRDHIAAMHSYDVPEIVRVPITGGLAAYLKWMDDPS